MKRSYAFGSTVKLTGAIYASSCGSGLVGAVRVQPRALTIVWSRATFG